MFQYYQSNDVSAAYLRSVQILQDKCRLGFKLTSQSRGADFYVVILSPNHKLRRNGALSGICRGSNFLNSKVRGSFYESDSGIHLEFFVINPMGGMIWRKVRLDIDLLTLTADSCCLN